MTGGFPFNMSSRGAGGGGGRCRGGAKVGKRFTLTIHEPRNWHHVF